MINNEYFDIYHRSRENSPDGLIDKSNVMTDIVNILDHFYEMKPYTRRGPAFTAARIVESVSTHQDASIALTIILMNIIRGVVDNDPTRTVAAHLKSMFDSDLLNKLQTELSALPYRSVAVDGQVKIAQCEDYSVVSLLCDQFPFECIIEDSETDDEDLRYEIIDEADIEPEADEDD